MRILQEDFILTVSAEELEITLCTRDHSKVVSWLADDDIIKEKSMGTWRGDPYSGPAPGRMEVCACTNIMRPLCGFLPDRFSDFTAGPLKPISRSTTHSGSVKVVLCMGVATGQGLLKLMMIKQKSLPSHHCCGCGGCSQMKGEFYGWGRGSCWARDKEIIPSLSDYYFRIFHDPALPKRDLDPFTHR